MSDANLMGLVTIRAEVSLTDPNACKFTVNRTVHAGGSWFFDSRERASGSPLPERLFDMGGVSHVLVGENVVTVGKLREVPWSGLKSAIGAAIRDQLRSGVPAILENRAAASETGRSDAEVCGAIQELLDREINRGIASHGGRISLVAFQNGRLSIAMSGGCQGCASAQLTLRQGLAVMVRRVAPEVVEIVDTTDHAAGTTPFYLSPKSASSA